MTTRASIGLAAIVLIAIAMASFAVGFGYSRLDDYMLVQFALAVAWFTTAVVLVMLWGKTAKLTVWLLVGLTAPVALFYPAQVVALLLSFTFQGFV